MPIKRLLTAALVLVLGASANVASAQSKLSLAYFENDKGSIMREAMMMIVDRIQQNSNGTIEISRIVGPESIPAFEMTNALKNGIVDIAVVPESYASSVVNGVEAMSSATVPPKVQRTNGAFEILQEMFEQQANARYLGAHGFGGNFHLLLNKPISSIEDLKGLRLRTSETYRPALEAFGVEAVQTKRGEIYTAMERGVIDGFPQLPANIKPAGWQEIIDYKVEPGFYTVSTVLIVNNEVWDRLSEEQKEAFEEAGAYSETEVTDWLVARANERESELSELGIETISLSEEESREFLRLAYDAKWESIAEKAPEVAEKLQPLLYNPDDLGKMMR